MRLLNLLPLSFFLWCENMPLGLWIRKATWVFAIIETIHIMALAVLLGTMIVVDLRLLGFGMRRQSTAEVARLLAPWTWGSLVVMVLTGVSLFTSEAVRLSRSAPFAYKMLFLALAITAHFTIHSRATTVGIREGAGFGKVAACLSIIFWLGVALAGRAIAFL
jgi:uncharacterized protein DUF6644